MIIHCYCCLNSFFNSFLIFGASKSTLFQITHVTPAPGNRRCSASTITVFSILNPQNKISFGCSLTRAANPLLLHRILAVPDAGGVQQRHRITVEVEMHLDHVARRPRHRRHDGDLALGDPVEQRRLAGVRRPGNRHHQPVAQPLAAMRTGQRRRDLVAKLARRFSAPAPSDPRARPPRRKNRSAPRPAPAPGSAAPASSRRDRRADP